MIAPRSFVVCEGCVKICAIRSLPLQSLRVNEKKELCVLRTFKAYAADAPLPPLPEAHYVRAHEAFRAATNQQALIEDWFRTEMAVQPYGALSVLSVGCGSGLLDAALLAMLQARANPLHYTGIDPNPAQIAAFTARMMAAAGGSSHVRSEVATLDDFCPAASFDAIFVVQTFYYVPDVRAALARCWEWLKPGGRLVVVNAPCEALNRLSDVVWSRQLAGPWYSEDVARACEALGLACRRDSLHAQLDVGDCAAPDGAGSPVLDFILQTDAAALPAPVRAEIAAYLSAHADGRHIAHPVDVFSLRKAA